MEVKVYYKDGIIEAHRIPDYVGSNETTAGDFDSSHTSSLIDSVSHISECFYRSEDGYTLEYAVDLPARLSWNSRGSKKIPAKTVTRTAVVVPSDKITAVKYILLDGEQVYPVEDYNESKTF